MFDRLAAPDNESPEPDLSEQRLAEMLGDIKRNSRNRRIAMVAPVVLAAAVLGAMIAAPPQHGGITEFADAESADPQLPRVFGTNGVWRLAEPIEESPAGNPGPADMIQAATEPSSPEFSLSPPTQEDLHSLPASTSTPPMSTSGQSLDAVSPSDLDWSDFSAVIRIEPEAAAEPADAGRSTPVQTTTHDNSSRDENVTVADDPQSEPTTVHRAANPSTPPDDLVDSEAPTFDMPATIVPLSVPLVTGAHVSVTVHVVDDDSSVIDWCNTRVDWGDGSVTRAAGADDAALCTASCEYGSTSSVAGNISTANNSRTIDEVLHFQHDYADTIDVAPRIFVATGDGCSYTIAELQLPQFTVVPLL